MMVLKAKLEISRSSTIVIKEVFAKSTRIRRTNRMNLLRQSGSVVSEPAPRARVVAYRPQAIAASWW